MSITLRVTYLRRSLRDAAGARSTEPRRLIRWGLESSRWPYRSVLREMLTVLDAESNRGAIQNPDLAFEIARAGLHLSAGEIDDIVAFLGTLEGEGWQDSGPSRFPQ